MYGFWMEQRLARSRCYVAVFVLSTFFIQVPFSSYKPKFLLSTRFLCFFDKPVYNFDQAGQQKTPKVSVSMANHGPRKFNIGGLQDAVAGMSGGFGEILFWIRSSCHFRLILVHAGGTARQPEAKLYAPVLEMQGSQSFSRLYNLGFGPFSVL